jgi:hypothetical protein
LFRIDADLLAHASLLLDDVHHVAAAKAHGETAALCAEEAGCSPALVLSAQAKTARWQGARLGRRDGARHFAQSADLARRGFECSPRNAPVRVLLASQEASASALLGDAVRARRALWEAENAASSIQTLGSWIVYMVVSGSSAGALRHVGSDKAARPRWGPARGGNSRRRMDIR